MVQLDLCTKMTVTTLLEDKHFKANVYRVNDNNVWGKNK